MILHATEDLQKFLKIFDEQYSIKQNNFVISNLKGHFDNPITMLSVEISEKDDVLKLVKKIVMHMTESQIQDILKDIETRISEDSTLYLRFDKQKFIEGTLEIQEKNSPIQIKISFPTYEKNKIYKTYSELLRR